MTPNEKRLQRQIKQVRDFIDTTDERSDSAKSLSTSHGQSNKLCADKSRECAAGQLIQMDLKDKDKQ